MTMMQEVEALHRNNTWKFGELPKGQKVISCKWIYKMKRDDKDQMKRFHARLVVKGYAMRYQ